MTNPSFADIGAKRDNSLASAGITDLMGYLLQFVAIEIYQRELCTLLGQCHCHGPAEPATSAGDERYLSG